MNLSGQTALVTGAGSGIGKAIAIELGKRGANLGINFHTDEKEAQTVADEIKMSGGKAIIIKADISKESEILKMFDTLYREFKTIDILVNNAGIQRDSKFTEMTLKEWQQVIDTNLTGQFLCAREAAKEFLRRGVIKDRSMAAGKIIFISSVHSVIPWAGHDNYAASKGGEMMLMKSLAQELAYKKVRVNAIAPGAIKTDINKPVWSDPKKEKDLMKLIPYQRIGEPEDVARLTAWLVSDDADYITGATIYIDGGMTLFPSFAHGG